MYTVAEFLLAYPDQKWAAIATTDIERAISFVSCLYDDFCCYEPKYHSCLWELAVAHQLEISGALCSEVSPWFSPGVSEVKSYNDTIKFGDSGADGLGRTYYGQQFSLLLQRAKKPVLYFSGLTQCTSFY
jgi:hypothetical protein